MGQRHTVSKLNPEQQEFVVERLAEGGTLRSICAAFEKEFGAKLPRSSLASWANAVGEVAVQHYRFSRAVARQVIEQAGDEQDAFKRAFGDFEDRLLMASADVFAKSPKAVLAAVLEKKRLEQDAQKIELKRREVELKEKLANQRPLDELIRDFVATLVEVIGTDPEGLQWFARNADRLALALNKRFFEQTPTGG